MKYLYLFLFLLGASAQANDHAPLVIGMELSYPPFEMTDTKGNPSGISVEIARDLGKFLQREVRIENISFDGLIPSLKTGKIDLILSSMTATPERAQAIAFSDPYLTTGLCLLLPKKSTLNDITELNNTTKTVAVKKGTTGHLYALSSLPKARLLVLDKESSAVLEVIQNKADAFIYDQMSVFKNAQKSPDLLRAQLQPFQLESWAIGLRTKDKDLKFQVNAFIHDYRKNGGFTRLGDLYLKEQKDAFKQQSVPFIF